MNKTNRGLPVLSPMGDRAKGLSINYNVDSKNYKVPEPKGAESNPVQSIGLACREADSTPYETETVMTLEEIAALPNSPGGINLGQGGP